MGGLSFSYLGHRFGYIQLQKGGFQFPSYKMASLDPKKEKNLPHICEDLM